MSLIADTCEQIVASLSSLGSPIAKLLRPALTEQQISKAQEALPFVLPSSVVGMYKWRNGTKRARGAEFFPWWVFDSLETSIQRYQVLASPDDGLWAQFLFPVFSASDVSSMGILCKEAPTNDGEIYCYEYMLGTELEYANMEAMCRTILEACASRVIFFNKDRMLDYDAREFACIARRYNSGVPRWDE